MATFGELKAQVLRTIVRTDLGAETADLINEAIQEYAVKRFWFTESRTLTFNTIASQELYGEAAHASIPNLVRIDSIFLTEGTSKFALERMTDPALEYYAQPNETPNQPTRFSYSDLQIRLFPIPDRVYPVRVIGYWRPAPLVNDADTNAFTIHAAKLIRLAATRMLYQEHIRSPQDAADIGRLEIEAFSRLNIETLLRLEHNDTRLSEQF